MEFPSTPREPGIVLYFHCRRCWDEKPHGIGMNDWAKLVVGVLANGRLRVWCERHQRDVGTTAEPIDPALMTSAGDHECSR